MFDEECGFPDLSRLVDPNSRIANLSIPLESEASTRVRGFIPKAHSRVIVAEKAVPPAHGLARWISTLCVPRRTHVNALVQADCWRVDCIVTPTTLDGLTAYFAELKCCGAKLWGVDGVIRGRAVADKG